MNFYKKIDANAIRSRPFGIILGFLVGLWGCSSSAVAQWNFDPVAQAYFITDDTTFTYLLDPNGESFIGRDILVGKNNRTDFQTLPGTITLTLTDEFSIFEDSGQYVYPDGLRYAGVQVFGQHRIVTQDVSTADSYPYIWNLALHDTSVVNLNGGKVEHDVNVTDSATFTASGSGIRRVHGWNNSTITMNAGSALVYLADSAQGTFTNTSLGELILYGSSRATVTNLMGCNSLSTSGDSVAEINSGAVGLVVASNASTIHMTAVSAGLLETYDNATIRLSGDLSSGHLKGSSTLYIETGDTEVHFLTVDEAANVIVNGGVLDRFVSLVEGTITLNKGALEGYAYLFGESVLNLKGGTIADTELFKMGDGSLFNFFGQSLEFSNPIAGIETGYNAEGVFYDLAWVREDGTLIESRFFDRWGDVGNAVPRGFTFTIVPEPACGILVVTGLLATALRRSRRYAHPKVCLASNADA